MAWDATFDWANASSFNGEGRKLSIMDEIITQLNLKATCIGDTPISIPSAGGTVGINTLNNYFTSIATQFYKDVEVDGSKWTLALLETAIGSSIPGIFSPAWINWMYQAINLLLYPTDITQFTVSTSNFTKTVCSSDTYPGTCPCTESSPHLSQDLSHSFGGSYLVTMQPGSTGSTVVATYDGATYSKCGRDAFAEVEINHYSFGDYRISVFIGLSVGQCDTVFYTPVRPEFRLISADPTVWRSTQVVSLRRDQYCTVPSVSSITVAPVLSSC